MSQTGSIHEALSGTSPRGLLAYTAPGPNRESAIKQLVCSVDVENDVAGASRLTRMLIRWGHGKAQQSAVADLASCRFSLLASSLRVDVFEDIDVAGSYTEGAIVKASAIVTEGYCEPSLTYTTPSYAYNGALPWYGYVPKYARAVSAVSGNTSPPWGEGCPFESYITFYRFTSSPTQSIELAPLFTKPHLISPWGGLQGWYLVCQDMTATQRFRLLFQLGI